MYLCPRNVATHSPASFNLRYDCSRPRQGRRVFAKPRQNATIDNHYSLSDWFESDDDSNTFFHYWLDRAHRMYSCGKLDQETKTLEESETNKLELYAKRMGIDERSRGSTLLDLGCGWGGVSFFMTERFGVCAKGLALSTAHHRYITREIAWRQLHDLVSVELRNVDDMEGTYDYIFPSACWSTLPISMTCIRK